MAEAEQPAASSSSKSVPQSDVWELDFCSRPILDERGKKVRQHGPWGVLSNGRAWLRRPAPQAPAGMEVSCQAPEPTTQP